MPARRLLGEVPAYSLGAEQLSSRPTEPPRRKKALRPSALPRVRDQPVRARPHVLETRGLDETRASIGGGHLDRRVAREPAHLALEVGRRDRRSGPARRWRPSRRAHASARCHITPGSESSSLRGSASCVDPREQPLPQRRSRRGGPVGRGLAGQLAHRARGRGCPPGGRATPPCRAGAARPRCRSTRGSSGIPSSGVWVLMNRRWCCAVEAARTSRRPALTSQSSHGDSSDERRGQVGGLEHQQRADHLHPGRAALRPGADDDVARRGTGSRANGRCPRPRIGSAQGRRRHRQSLVRHAAARARKTPTALPPRVHHQGGSAADPSRLGRRLDQVGSEELQGVDEADDPVRRWLDGELLAVPVRQCVSVGRPYEGRLGLGGGGVLAGSPAGRRWPREGSCRSRCG